MKPITAEELEAERLAEAQLQELAAGIAASTFDGTGDEWIDLGYIEERSARAAGARPKLDPVVVKLVEEVGGRTTRWVVECPTHGRFPLDVRSKTAAIVVGGRHIEGEHFGEGRLRLRRRRRRA